MNGKCLVDTNVLVYAVDLDKGDISAVANRITRLLLSERRAVTTPQAVIEFYNSTTRPKGRAQILSRAAAVAWLESWLDTSECLNLTAETSSEALRACRKYQMSIYDAQMWAVAKVYAIPTLITQDLQSQPVIEGVRYVNPFLPAFKLADIGL